MSDNGSLLYLKAAIEAAKMLATDSSLPAGSVVSITVVNSLGEYINSSSCIISHADVRMDVPTYGWILRESDDTPNPLPENHSCPLLSA